MTLGYKQLKNKIIGESAVDFMQRQRDMVRAAIPIDDIMRKGKGLTPADTPITSASPFTNLWPITPKPVTHLGIGVSSSSPRPKNGLIEALQALNTTHALNSVPSTPGQTPNNIDLTKEWSEYQKESYDENWKVAGKGKVATS